MLNKSFWEEIINTKENHPIIEGVCYYVNIYKPIKLINTKYNGFGGRWFKILMNGKIIITNNLYHNGTVPDEYKEQLPDNAKFLEITQKEINNFKSKI